MIFERRRPSPESSEPKRNKWFRLRVYWDPDYGLTSISDEQVTSLNDNAEQIKGGQTDEIQMTTVEVEWLHEQLTELLKTMREHAIEVSMENTEIIVNGKTVTVVKAKTVSFEELIALAGMTGSPSMTIKRADILEGFTLTPRQGCWFHGGETVNIAHTGAA